MNNQIIALFCDFKYITTKLLNKFNKDQLIIFGYSLDENDFDYICSKDQLEIFKSQNYKFIDLKNINIDQLVNKYQFSKVHITKSFTKIDHLLNFFSNTIIEDDLLDINQAKQALINADVKKFNKIAGFNYTFSGIVTHCNHLGRTIGFPTANILTNTSLVIKNGVYLVKVTIDDQIIKYGMGDHWINRNNLKVFETYIFNFSSDIYNSKITFELLDYIRDNQKIESLDQLKALLNNDKNECLKRLEKYNG
ncbi:riboflavin kinase [Mycoplasma feriruminatoris]|uniref:riboflavin kinase n=1 Tax=Mycoplasma feriruminatoris TaxID=1179777 RepID=A0ABY8HW38_9MOLU|nr:riboflavin kinase [Mycoplasma feriruminatoris]UKS53777.1 riboflavin kinase family protein [Mycoplasma feriruminatoris]WFQ90695.1 riboflavin kinase [Mycoplasma feriruminatoris]WFQ93211.1 riboflavin kinase [Mycoplasma feriruminatoris]VZK64959.1 Riboflavin biosynthesis protein RibF [Mycoplasma feriruminatoris]VZR75102.1 Riboflavin biosynthesis protein RibF [Mycoplasma feriruminatoris]